MHKIDLTKLHAHFESMEPVIIHFCWILSLETIIKNVGNSQNVKEASKDIGMPWITDICYTDKGRKIRLKSVFFFAIPKDNRTMSIAFDFDENIFDLITLIPTKLAFFPLKTRERHPQISSSSNKPVYLFKRNYLRLNIDTLREWYTIIKYGFLNQLDLIQSVKDF